MAVRTLILLACFTLTACANTPFGTKDRAKQEAATTAPAEPRYCYRTIGKVNCYSQPLDGKEANRLVGYEGPAPRPDAGTGPLTP